MKSINKNRVDYIKGAIDENSLEINPLQLFEQWMSNALSYVKEPNAFTLSTVSEKGIPSSRVLLLRDINDSGFVFFSNYRSQKGLEISLNPNVSMNFFWPELEQQIRINGCVEEVSGLISDAYFESRPYKSQISAWSSPQSHIIESRQILNDNVEFYTKKYIKKVPRPPHWGGYIVIPNKMEFWQGRSNRLHDRILYSKDSDHWCIDRLAP